MWWVIVWWVIVWWVTPWRVNVPNLYEHDLYYRRHVVHVHLSPSCDLAMFSNSYQHCVHPRATVSIGGNCKLVSLFSKHEEHRPDVDNTGEEFRHAYLSGNSNLVPRAHVPFGQHQDTELWNNQFPETKGAFHSTKNSGNSG